MKTLAVTLEVMAFVLLVGICIIEAEYTLKYFEVLDHPDRLCRMLHESHADMDRRMHEALGR